MSEEMEIEEAEREADAKYGSDLQSIASSLVQQFGRGAPYFAASQQFIAILLADTSMEQMWGQVGLIALGLQTPPADAAALH